MTTGETTPRPSSYIEVGIGASGQKPAENTKTSFIGKLDQYNVSKVLLGLAAVGTVAV